MSDKQHWTLVDDDKRYCIAFELVNPKLISVNDMYIHPVRKCKNGKYRSYFAKSPYLKEVQEYFAEVLPECIPESEVVKIKKVLENRDKELSLEFIIGIPEKEFYEHDATNFVKAPEDCISKYLGIDDSRNVEVMVGKWKVTNSEDWSLTTTINTVAVHLL